jgi:hypothetical protein
MARGGRTGWIITGAGAAITGVGTVLGTVAADAISSGDCPGALSRIPAICEQIGLEPKHRSTPNRPSTASPEVRITVAEGGVGKPAEAGNAVEPAGTVGLVGRGIGQASARLASEIEAGIRQRLRPVAVAAGTAITYELSALSLAGGADRRVQATWTISTPGKPEARCEPLEIVFYSGPILAERLVARFDASLAATVSKGEPVCG